MIEDLICSQCGQAYTGDPGEARLCLDCDYDNVGERTVSVFVVNTIGDGQLATCGTLTAALKLAKTLRLADEDWCIDEIEPLSYHGIDVHYRDEAHARAYRAAHEAAKQAYWKSRPERKD